jgi:hypothetical protein
MLRTHGSEVRSAESAIRSAHDLPIDDFMRSHYSGPNLRWLPSKAALATQDFRLHQSVTECVPLGRFRRDCVELFCQNDWRLIDRKSGRRSKVSRIALRSGSLSLRDERFLALPEQPTTPKPQGDSFCPNSDERVSCMARPGSHSLSIHRGHP